MTSSIAVIFNSVLKKLEPLLLFRIHKFDNFISSFGDRSFIGLLVLLNAVFLLPGIGGESLLPQGDETMHIATIRESLLSGSFLFPKFEGVLNLYKPPALFWLGMLSDSIFGIGFFSERFPSFLLFLFVSILIYVGLRRANADAKYAFWFASSYVFTLGVFKFARLAMMEALLAFFIAAVAVLVLEFRLSNRRRWLVLAGIVSGIAILVKGPLFQIYSAALLGAYSSYRIFLLSDSGKWTGAKRIWKELQHHLLFHTVSILVPAVWILVLMLYSSAGGEFLRVFFLTENLGKFSSATSNQGEWIIPLGFLLYTFPFCFGIFFAFVSGLFQKKKNLPSLLGSSFLWGIIAIAIVHLSPNRKDFYYLLPVIPVSFLGIGLTLIRNEDGKVLKWLSWNVIFSSIAFLLLLVGMTVFSWFTKSFSWQEPAFFTVFLVAFFFCRRGRLAGVPSNAAGNLILAILLLSYIQFSLLPRVSLSEVPEEGPILSAKQICVVSENPWTALTFKNAFPGIEVSHSIPGAERNCIDGKRHLIAFDPNFSGKERYRLVQTRQIWKRDLSWKELLSPSQGKDFVYFFEPIWNFDSASPEKQ